MQHEWSLTPILTLFSFTHFPYVLPPQVTHLDLSGSKLILPPGESLENYIPSELIFDLWLY